MKVCGFQNRGKWDRTQKFSPFIRIEISAINTFDKSSGASVFNQDLN